MGDIFPVNIGIHYDYEFSEWSLQKHNDFFICEGMLIRPWDVDTGHMLHFLAALMAEVIITPSLETVSDAVSSFFVARLSSLLAYISAYPSFGFLVTFLN